MSTKLYRQDLAELHNLYYADYVTKAGPGALAELRRAGIHSGVVLDLGCGGGQLSLRLLEAGYRPVGVDVSAAMLRLARKRVRSAKARFVLGSISQTRLPPCAAAIAVGEVFNYLPSRKVTETALRNVFRALAPGGILLFDVKEPLPGRETKLRILSRSGKDWAIFVEVEEDPRSRRLVRRIVTFRKIGSRYRRDDEVHRAILYKSVEVARMLRAAGFTTKIAARYGRFRLSPDRKVLIASKPAKI